MKTNISVPNLVYQSNENIELELVDMQLAAEFAAWDIASDEAFENFERELEYIV
ncbi:MAG: hypothetical protein IPM31_15625 [Anaerolineae bacterium]|nr:hypothetical protein [Anaerolineae bacterium]MBL8105836.1 hypothetical protein [Anaerolineales bacterium]